MRKLLIPTVIILSMVLSSCNLPSGTNAPADDAQMQTEIAALLTAMVTITPTPEVTMTPIPTETPKPTDKPSPTSTIESETVEPEETISVTTPEFISTEGTQELIETTPTVTQQSTDDPVNNLGQPSWIDTFDNGTNWSLSEDKYVRMQVSGGSLSMIGLTAESGWRISNQNPVNFYLETSGKMVSCSGSDHFGVIFRATGSGSQAYLFGITCDGRYILRKWLTDTMSSLIAFKASDAINKGANHINRIGVMIKGNEIKLYVNGKLVATTKDSSLSTGNIGVYVSAKETKNLTAQFEEMKYWLIQ